MKQTRIEMTLVVATLFALLAVMGSLNAGTAPQKDDVAKLTSAKTLQGKSVSIETSNGVIHVIDAVIVPQP